MPTSFWRVRNSAFISEQGYTPKFQGVESYKGEIVHPQKWNAGVVCKDKKVVVIGSGATAATLVPAIADTVASVTMLQRSPGYWASIPMKGYFLDRVIKGMLRPVSASRCRCRVRPGKYFISAQKRVHLFSSCTKNTCAHKHPHPRCSGVPYEFGPPFDAVHFHHATVFPI